MTEPGEGWRRFVAVNAVVAALEAVLLWGIYLYWFAELSDFFLFGAIVIFVIDICGIFGLSLAAVLQLFGWRLRKNVPVLVGLAIQILVGLPYSGLVASEGAFLTPGMIAGVLSLAMGLAGVFFYVVTPKEDRS